jgi:hypothetical protein
MTETLNYSKYQPALDPKMKQMALDKYKNKIEILKTQLKIHQIKYQLVSIMVMLPTTKTNQYYLLISM